MCINIEKINVFIPVVLLLFWQTPFQVNSMDQYCDPLKGPPHLSHKGCGKLLLFKRIRLPIAIVGRMQPDSWQENAKKIIHTHTQTTYLYIDMCVFLYEILEIEFNAKRKNPKTIINNNKQTNAFSNKVSFFKCHALS